MLRSRHLLSTALGTMLLVIAAGPSFAGPAPLEDTGVGGRERPASVPTSSDPGLWSYIGYAVAALVVIALVMVVFTTLSRHAHHRTPHPA